MSGVSIVVTGVRMAPSDPDVEKASQFLKHKLSLWVDHLTNEDRGIIDSPKLHGIARELGCLERGSDLQDLTPGEIGTHLKGSIVTLVSQARVSKDATLKADFIGRLDRSLEIARGTRSPILLSDVEKTALRQSMVVDYALELDQGLVRCTIDHSKSMKAHCQSLFEQLRDLGKVGVSCSVEVAAWLEKNCAEATARDQRVSVGTVISYSQGKSFEEQQHLLKSAGFNTPDRAPLMIAKALLEAVYSVDHFQSHSIRIGKQMALKDSNSGFEMVHGMRAEKYGVAMGMKVEQL